MNYPLDLIAGYYAAIKTAQWHPMFRYTAVLKQPVDPVVLQAALDRTLPRFPYFNVILKSGFMNHYLQDQTGAVLPEDDRDIPFIQDQKRRNLFRVTYHDKKISLEMQHMLGDGFGAVVFLKTLVAQYFCQLGVYVPSTHDIQDVCSKPDPEEYEDSLRRYSSKSSYHSGGESRAYHVGGALLSQYNIRLITGVTDASRVLEKAHRYGVSVTEYLTAALARVLCSLQHEELLSNHKEKRPLPVRISVSTDLRHFFPTKSLRNFVQYSNLCVQPWNPSFEETLSSVRDQMKKVFTKENLSGRMSENRRWSNYVKPLPLFCKRAIVLSAHNLIGDRVFTMNLTNVGRIEMPESISNSIVRFDTMGNNFRNVKIECGAVTYNGRLSITFSSALAHTKVQDGFFGFMEQEGIPFDLEQNDPWQEAIR